MVQAKSNTLVITTFDEMWNKYKDELIAQELEAIETPQNARYCDTLLAEILALAPKLEESQNCDARDLAKRCLYLHTWICQVGTLPVQWVPNVVDPRVTDKG